MSSPNSNQNMEQADNVPVDPVPEVPVDDNFPVVPLESPEVQAMEPANANVPEVLANANIPVQPPEVQAVGPANDNVPGACAPLGVPQNESSSSSSDGSFEEYLPHMVKMNLSLSTSSPATSSTLGSSKTPTLSTDMEERSSLTGTPSSEGSVEGGEVPALTSEQMIKEIVNRLPDSNQQSAQKSKMDVDSQGPKDAPEGSASDARETKPIQQVKTPLTKIPRLPPLQTPATLPVVQSPKPQQRATTLPPIPGAVVTTAPLVKSSVPVLPPVASATGGHTPPESSRGVSKQSPDDSSLSTTSESVQSESDSPKKPSHSKVEVLKRTDSSDGSKADESSASGASPELHKKKALHKKVPKVSSGTTPSPKAIREIPTLSRADTLDDVDTIKTDSVSFHSNPSPFVRPLSPERDRRAISLPADPPQRDPKMAPQERRAYSEAKAQETEVLPIPPPQSLDTSISWQSSDPVDPPSGVRSEPVKRVTEKVTPALQAISEGHSPLPPEDQQSSVYSPCIPEILMEDEQCSEVVAYAGDLSTSNSGVEPMGGRHKKENRRADEEADRQVQEFNAALAEAQRVSSGRGTDSNAPSSTLGTSSEARLAPALAGYAGWLLPRNVSGDDEASQSTSKSDSSSDQNFQMMQGWLGSGSQGQSGAGPSGIRRSEEVGMDTLAVIPEKGESLSPSTVSGSLSPAEMEGIDEHLKSHGEDDRRKQKEGNKSEDVEMSESEKDPKSCLVVNLQDDDPQRTPKRKREQKKSTDDSPKDSDLLSPGEDSKKKYCSEFSRPVMAGQIARSSSTGSVKPDQVQRVDVESLKKLAEKKASEKKKSPSEESARDPNKESKKDPKDKEEPSA